jgi:hypothetical protein
VVEILEVVNQVLDPQARSLSDRSRLSWLEVRESERRQVLVLAGEGREPGDQADQLAPDQSDPLAEQDQVGVVGDVARRRAEAKDGYTWRSKAVHGARLKTVDESTRLRVWAEAERLLRRALVKILLDSDLTSSFASTSRERFLDDLIFEN